MDRRGVIRKGIRIGVRKGIREWVKKGVRKVIRKGDREGVRREWTMDQETLNKGKTRG